MPEEIQEQGFVLETHNGIATVSVARSEACKACGARILCRTSGEENPRVIAQDPLGVKPGDHVRISAPGRSVLLASFSLYGIPLLLLLLGIALGAKLFLHHPELYGSLLGIGLCALYYFIVRIVSKSDRWKQHLLPRIDRIL
ncbi:MAG: SoxR reducing system RseC family protein [Acidobacteria bacterium]|nr:SoxR reducing system RseC family protein [Acidobacteriota bacterium]